ncbi:DUF6249 domain-containing protein [Polaribacter aestuariivivens]|uniref:DUF6249 domain-containing protein n=1 Tax=Polaribacter aestuariivivens TaxID=2304626 RepID=UPI003F4910F4
MGPGTVFIFLFAVVFGIFYLYFSTRNKERLALIEKGADASIFMKGEQNRKAAPFWKVLILNLGLLAVGIGVGILLTLIIGDLLPEVPKEPLVTGLIFLCGGIALLVGFNITKNLDKE